MKATVTSVLLLLLLAAHAAAQQSAAKSTPGLAEAARLNAEAVRLYAAGKYAEALTAAARVLELREKELGPSHPSVGSALVNLAATESALGKSDEAKAHYRRAADVLEEAGDEAARTLIGALEGLARFERDINGAVGLHKRILALKEKASELAAYSARFTPTYVNGKPVKVRGVITYNFVLR